MVIIEKKKNLNLDKRLSESSIKNGNFVIGKPKKYKNSRGV